MSPLWRDQLRIALCPDKVVIVRLEKGLQPKVTKKIILPCVSASGGPAWQPAIEALTKTLSEDKTAKADAIVILSNHFVRYALLPWSEEIKNKSDELALARICFEKTYGDSAGGWSLRISDAGYGAPRLASAVDQELLDALVSALAPTRLRLSSVQPYLMAAFNRWHRRLAGASCFFVLAESDRVCIAALQQGKWQGVRTLQIKGGLAETLPGLLAREILVTGAESTTKVYLHVPEMPGLTLPAGSAIALEFLSLPAQAGFSPLTDARFGMALSGVN